MNRADLDFLEGFPLRRALRATLLSMAREYRDGYERVLTTKKWAEKCSLCIRSFQGHIAALHAAGLIHVEHRRSTMAPYPQIANRITIYAPGWFASDDRFHKWYEEHGHTVPRKTKARAQNKATPRQKLHPPPPQKLRTSPPPQKLPGNSLKTTTRAIRDLNSEPQKDADAADESWLAGIDLASLPTQGSA